MEFNEYSLLFLYPSKKCSASNNTSSTLLDANAIVSLIISKFLFKGIFKAFFTWKSQDFPTKQTVETPELRTALSPESF